MFSLFLYPRVFAMVNIIGMFLGLSATIHTTQLQTILSFQHIVETDGSVSIWWLQHMILTAPFSP